VLVRDVTQVRLREREMITKDATIREIHHRVKNNLQIISSMLNLQGDRTGDDQAREVFAESEIRIRAMALVHEQLYRSGDLAHVDLSSYLHTLAAQILRYFGRSDCSAEVRVDDAVRDVGVDQAIPLGLIVNELLSNAVRHGFADGRSGTVEVVLREVDGGRELIVRDDGLGIPAGVDPEARGTLGLKLVRALAGQLGATVTIERDSGTAFRLVLPEHRLREKQDGGRAARAGRNAA
jgi:two-component sensor histidine kinase